MTAVLRELAAEGSDLTPAALAALSPYTTEPIKRFGEYVPTASRSRPPRLTRASTSPGPVARPRQASPHEHGATRLSRLNAGEQLLYTFDMGDDWTHLCTVAEQRIDPLQGFGIIPDRPLAYWGWGEIPDQYGVTTTSLRHPTVKIWSQARRTNPTVGVATDGELVWEERIAVAEQTDTMAERLELEPSALHELRRQVRRSDLVGRDDLVRH